jgi:SAM-dependent methyltransferase
VTVNREEEGRDRAMSFAAVADAYERARPGYPEDAVLWLAGVAPRDVVDLGAGTGKLTRTLVALGHRVTAVEPLPEMIAHLQEAVPGVPAVVGEAEAIPLADASADVVTVAQAFHWFDHAPALREIARVLRPGGTLALVWNTRDEREPWVAQLSEEALGTDSIEREAVAAPVGLSGLFGEVERASFAFAQHLDRERLVELVLSRSYCAVLTPGERQPVLEHVEQLFDEHAVDGVVELPYVTECFRAPRL